MSATRFNMWLLLYIFLGMVTAMDTAVGVVVEALKKYGFWDDCVFVFTTDVRG